MRSPGAHCCMLIGQFRSHSDTNSVIAALCMQCRTNGSNVGRVVRRRSVSSSSSCVCLSVGRSVGRSVDRSASRQRREVSANVMSSSRDLQSIAVFVGSLVGRFRHADRGTACERRVFSRPDDQLAPVVLGLAARRLWTLTLVYHCSTSNDTNCQIIA